MSRPFPYQSLPRKGATRKGPAPVYPRNVPYPAWLVRVAEKFRLPMCEVDEWSMDVILDEREIIEFIHDVDNPPE